MQRCDGLGRASVEPVQDLQVEGAERCLVIMLGFLRHPNMTVSRVISEDYEQVLKNKEMNMDPTIAELVSKNAMPADTGTSPELLNSFTTKLEEQKKTVTEEFGATANGEQAVQLTSNVQMSTDSSHDPFASITRVQAQEAQQEIRFQAIENGEQTGLNKPVASAGEESDISLVSKFIETTDNQLNTVVKELESLKTDIAKPELSLEQKAEKCMEMTGKVATTAFQLQTGFSLAKGSERATETVIRGQ